MAPEVIEGKKYSEKADVYSAGVIFWEIASRKRFFSEIAFLSQVEDMVIAGERPSIPQDCLDEVPEFAEVIRDCWQNDPSARPSFKQVVERIAQIIEERFPQVASYDAAAIRAYQDAQNDRNAMDRKRMDEREAKEKQRKEAIEQSRKLEKSLKKSLHKEVPLKRRQTKKKERVTHGRDKTASGDHSADEPTWTTGTEDDDEEEEEEEEETGEATEGTEGTEGTVEDDEEEEEEEDQEERKGSGIIVDRKKDQQHENLTKLMEVFLSRRTDKESVGPKPRRPRPLTASHSYSFLPVSSVGSFKADAFRPPPAAAAAARPALGASNGHAGSPPGSPSTRHSLLKSQTTAFLPIPEADDASDSDLMGSSTKPKDHANGT